MGILIGMDEAGYGPNLGPLVITATAWEVAGDPRDVDLWKDFSRIIGQKPADHGRHIQIADSKVVYSPARGLSALEQGVWAALQLLGKTPRTFRHLVDELLVAPEQVDDREPWYGHSELELPHCADVEPLEKLVPRWRERCEERGIRLRAIASDVISPRRFNRLINEHQSKGRALSHLSMSVLRHVWPIDADDRVLILADKHGGRNTYAEFLQFIAGDAMVWCQEEGMHSSRYKVCNAEARFESKGERHLPIALASMVSKYVRELAMLLFNRFWTTHLPELQPTAGYPGDARRFWTEIAPVRERLGIADAVLWRER